MLSNNIKCSEFKKAMRIIKDLIRLDCSFYLLDNSNKIKTLLNICNNNHFHKYKIINDCNLDFDDIIVIGLRRYDKTTKLLDRYIGTNTNIYIVPNEYGIYTDGTVLVNDGALLLTNLYYIENIHLK